ncbi:hypothetical protein D9Q98_010240 [Chlorella vulgaris]|uniref:Uncharacterized protein n=1 Tax=Chlorella vulgaris TaxID=3077 RepID=A0A9D4YUS8_CHLVU|nr:hypothetical protein D9Q98_010240 [Chlorella vulgaris]
MAITSPAVVAWQLRGPPIPQAHSSPVHHLVLLRQRWRGSVRSSRSSSSGTRAVAATTDDDVPAPARRQRGGRVASVVPQFDAQQLLRDVQLDGYGSANELSASMGKLPGIRQQGILQHGPQVAAHLRGLGIGSMLAPLLAAGIKGGGRTGEQLLGDLLKKQPAAVRLLQYNAEAVQRSLDSLLQLGLTKQQLAKALKVS